MIRRDAHYTVVIVNVFIALFLISIPVRRWNDQMYLARTLGSEPGGSGLETIRESFGFFLLSLLAIWGSFAEIRRHKSAKWVNIGVPVALFVSLAVEYALHRKDHPEENSIGLVVTALPLAVILVVYSAVYFRDRFIKQT